VRQSDTRPGDAAEAVATRILLYRLVRSALKKGLVTGPIPARPFLSPTTDPSPFFPGLGLAVRHAESFRQALLARAKLQRVFDQAPLTAWTVAAHSATRNLVEVQAAVGSAAALQRPITYPDLVRVPATVDRHARPMVFTGLSALALTRRAVAAPKGLAPKADKMGAWVQAVFTQFRGLPADPEECAKRIESLLQVAGRLELSGPERVSSVPDRISAAVDVERCLALDDAWPVRNAESEQVEDDKGVVILEAKSEEHDSPKRRASREQRALYVQLLAALDPSRMAEREGARSDGHRGQRTKIGLRLEALGKAASGMGNVALLVGYITHRYRFGGERTPELALRTLSSELSRFGSTLLDVAQDQDLLQWTATEFHQHYLAVILMKPVSVKRQCFDGLMNFHDYLRQVHQAQEIDEADLRRNAGQRIHRADAGLLTFVEVAQVHRVLLQDIEDEIGLPDAVPESIRILHLRELMFLLLEASAIRPASAYGLTLGDVALLGKGRDFLRIRDSGDYGSAKSASALGFVPLEGALWVERRAQVVKSVEIERHRITEAGEAWWKMPLFGRAPGSRRRIQRDHLTRRIDALLKWTTGDRRARTYWLRKTRVTSRHSFVASQPRPTAVDVYRTLRICGHASIETPLQHYIGDPAVAQAQSLAFGRALTRASILDLTGLQGTSLDVAWQRAGGASSRTRTIVVLDRLNAPTSTRPIERRTDPPALRRNRTLMPRHLAAYARALDDCADRQEAILRSGLTDLQVVEMEAVARVLVQKRGVTPWAFDGLRERGAVLKIPRRMEGTTALYQILDKEPPESLSLLAGLWVEQAHLTTLHEPSVVIEISGRATEEAVRWLIEKTGLRVSIKNVHGVTVLVGEDNDAPSRSHVAPLRWCLVLVWIFDTMKNRP